MHQRGRKSTAQLALLDDVPVEPPKVVEPPADMPEDQKEVWRRVVASCPPDWFQPETLDLLTQYCIHVCRSRFLAGLINGMNTAAIGTSTEKVLELMRQEHRQTRLVASLATKMRIAQQSSYDKSARKRGSGKLSAGTSNPWDDAPAASDTDTDDSD